MVAARGRRDHPAVAGRAGVDVAGGVFGTDAELVRAGSESGVVAGELHGAKAAPSSEHSKLAPCSFAEKVKLALVLLVGLAGPASNAVCGGVVSTVQVKTAGVGSTFPARSTARTANVCSPVDEVADDSRAGARGPGAGVQATLESAGLARAERELGRRAVAGIGRPAGQRRVGRGGVGRNRLDRPREGRGEPLVAGAVGRAHLERVQAVPEVGVDLWAKAGRPGAVVEPALEPGRLVGAEREARRAAVLGSAGRYRSSRSARPCRPSTRGRPPRPCCPRRRSRAPRSCARRRPGRRRPAGSRTQPTRRRRAGTRTRTARPR